MIYIQDRDSEYLNEITSLDTRRSSVGRTVRSPSVSSDRPTTALSFRPASRERELHSAKTSGPGNNPKFFHADDIRPALASIPSERIIEQGPANGFAGLGGRDGTSRVQLGSSPPVDELRPKFFFANDVVEPAPAPVPKSFTARTTKAPYPIHTGASPIANSAPQQQQRATSPLKEEIVSRRSSLSKPRRHMRLASNPKVGSEIDVASPESFAISQSNISRKSSLKSPISPQLSQAISSSVKADAPIAVRRGSVAWSEAPIVDSPQSYPDAGSEVSRNMEQIPSAAQEYPQVPTAGKPTLGQSKLDHMNELAANARRERKVLDLEISNSSLLAINRTLEREMRKQSAELRRFRRRSQPGRPSVGHTSRSTSNALSILSKSDRTGVDSDDLSDISTPSMYIDDDDADFSDDASDGSPSSTTSHAHANPLSASRFSRLRDKEAKRMHQDFARHRELLIDSQKLNEAIKRCLGRTEDLITDAKKALEYHVKIGGVETRGGRVLSPDEIEDDEIGQQRQGLLSPGVTDMQGMQWELYDDKKGDIEDTEDYAAESSDDNKKTSKSRDDESSSPPHSQITDLEPEPQPPGILDPMVLTLPDPKPSPPPPQSPPLERNEKDLIINNNPSATQTTTPDPPPPLPSPPKTNTTTTTVVRGGGGGGGGAGGMQGIIKEYLTNLDIGPSWGL